MRVAFLFFVSISAALISCTTETSPVAGGATDSPNARVLARVVGKDSIPRGNARVHLRPVDYLTEFSIPGVRKRVVSTADFTTDTDGRFVIDSVSPAEYRIEVTDRESTAVLLSCFVDETVDSILDLGTAVLRQFATLSGVVQTTGSLPSASVGVYGLERRVAVDSATGVWRIDDLPAGDFRLRIEPGSDEYGAAVIDAPYVSAGDSASLDTTVLMSYADEDYAAWTYSRSIRINTTPSGADVADDVHNFPLLVRLDTTALDFAHTATGGRDIRFSKSNGTPLRYEIDFWDADSARAAVWVLMDTVRGNDATQVFTMYWGGPSDAPDFSSPSAVFDTANGYSMVWHVNATPARDLSVIRDATANGVDGRSSMAGRQRYLPGIIGGAMTLGPPENSRGRDTIRIDESTSGAIGFGSSSFSIQFWGRNFQVGHGLRFHTPGYEYTPHRSRHQDITFTDASGSSRTVTVVDTTGVPAGWTLFCVVVDHSTAGVSFWKNGTRVGVDTLPRLVAGELKTEGPSYILGGAPEDLDEIRFEHAARSAGWIKLSYESQRRGSPVIRFR